MKTSKLIALVVSSIIIAVLLATALSNFTRVSDSALAENTTSPRPSPKGEDDRAVATPLTNYLPIIFLNSATAGGAWLLAGNTGTNWNTDFLGTTDKMTLTIRISNTVAYRLVPAVDPTQGWAPNLIGGSGANSINFDLHGATIAGGGVTGLGNIINGTGNFSFIGGGSGNNASNQYATVGGGNANNASNQYATVGGGLGNNASNQYATVGGGVGNLANGNSATVGGGDTNTASGNRATIGGGFSNKASGDTATVGGGWDNTASNSYATVGGGIYNNVSNQYATVGGGNANNASGYIATVGGGYGNTASGNFATVGGGSSNNASGYIATIAGGYGNTASGQWATIPGGYQNQATMTSTFAAGQKAQAVHLGAFVWADSVGVTLTSSADNQFLVRASGGITLFTGITATNGSSIAAGASLYAGSGSWNSLSNKNLKTNFADVDSRAILERVNDLPVMTWNYKTQDESIRHIGPTAQDFYAAFKVGENNTTISTIDAQGVALAAIQGLAQENRELKAQNANLEARVAALEAQSPASNPFTFSNLLLFGVLGLLAAMLVRRTKT